MSEWIRVGVEVAQTATLVVVALVLARAFHLFRTQFVGAVTSLQAALRSLEARVGKIETRLNGNGA